MSTRYQRSWLWSEALDLMDQAERMQRQFFRVAGAAPQAPRWEPPVDVIEDDHVLRVTVALPGVSPERTEIAIEQGVLRIIAVRRPPITAATRAVRALEIPYGRFERRIPLPAGRYELTEHEFRHGCLTIALQKRGERA
jgi:HSP20 family molecular chaperone IbpA